MSWATQRERQRLIYTTTLSLTNDANDNATLTLPGIEPGKTITLIANPDGTDIGSNDADVDLQASHDDSTFLTIAADVVQAIDGAAKVGTVDLAANPAPYYRLIANKAGSTSAVDITLAVIVEDN